MVCWLLGCVLVPVVELVGVSGGGTNSGDRPCCLLLWRVLAVGGVVTLPGPLPRPPRPGGRPLPLPLPKPPPLDGGVL